MTVTVWPAHENLQSFSALWRFEQGQGLTSLRAPRRTSGNDAVTDNNSEVAPSLEELWKRSRAGARAGAGFRFGSIDCLESLKWIVGGNIDAIAAAMARERKAPISDWRRFSRKRDGQFVQDQNGSIIVSHIMQHAASIRSRYVGANQRVRHDDAVREAWTNILCDMLGRPRPAPAPARYFPPRFWRAPN